MITCSYILNESDQLCLLIQRPMNEQSNLLFIKPSSNGGHINFVIIIIRRCQIRSPDDYDKEYQWPLAVTKDNIILLWLLSYPPHKLNYIST